MEIKLEVSFHMPNAKQRHEQQELSLETASNHIHDHFHSK